MESKKKLVIGTVLTLTVVFLVAAFAFKQNKKNELSFMALENVELFVRPYSPILGNKDAKVYLVEFLDPECESCKAFYPSVKQILKLYPNKIKLVARFVPFHKNSKHAIRVLEASKKQGKFWETLEIMFQTQSAWASHHDPQPQKVFDYLPAVGLDVAKIKKDMLSPEIEKIIKQDLEDARTLQVRGTPTFFVNGRALESFGLEQLKKLVEEEINKHY